MKMGNTVPKVGLEPISLAFRASMLPLHHIDFPDVTGVMKMVNILPRAGLEPTSLAFGQGQCATISPA